MNHDVDVTLFLWGDTLDPDAVARLFGQPPANVRRKGDVVVLESGEVQTASNTMIAFSTRNLVNGHRVGDHLGVIIKLLGQHISDLWKFGGLSKLRVSIIVNIEGQCDEGLSWEDEISSDSLKEFAGLGASLSLVVMCPSED